MIQDSVKFLSACFNSTKLRIVKEISNQALRKTIKRRCSQNLIHVFLDQNSF